MPRTEKDLLAAIVCVLEALKVRVGGDFQKSFTDTEQVLHGEPTCLHRDIRWPNVMRHLDNKQKWFIIDWGDAAMLGSCTAQSHFEWRTHSPRVFVDGHGTEVDIWGVGGLILDCGALDISSELRGLGEWMRGSAPPSAEEALDKILQYQSCH